MDTAERLLRECADTLRVMVRQNLGGHPVGHDAFVRGRKAIRDLDTYLSSVESKESPATMNYDIRGGTPAPAVRPATMAGDRWPGDPLPPAPTVQSEVSEEPDPLKAWRVREPKGNAILRHIDSLRSLLAQREERIKGLKAVVRRRTLIEIAGRCDGIFNAIGDENIGQLATELRLKAAQ